MAVAGGFGLDITFFVIRPVSQLHLSKNLGMQEVRFTCKIIGIIFCYDSLEKMAQIGHSVVIIHIHAKVMCQIFVL